MKTKLPLIISSIAILLIIIYIIIIKIFPNFTIDNVTLFLLIIAILPWLRSIIKSVEIPGLKIELQDFEKATEKAEKAGLIGKISENKPTYLSIANEDPRLALAGLRIEIEQRLKTLANANGIDTERQGFRQLLRVLSENNIISKEQNSVLNDVIGLLNSAVHGVEFDSKTANWAIDVGPRILSALDDRIANYKKDNS